MIRVSALMAGALSLSLMGTVATAQTSGVRDCRGGNDVVLPMVTNGHDAIAVHATDDLVGPSIFSRFAKTEDGDTINITTKAYDTYNDQLSDYLSCETPFMRVTHAQMSLMAADTEAQDATKMVPIFFYGWSNGAHTLVGRDADRVAQLNGAKLVVSPEHIDFALQLVRQAQDNPELIVSDTAVEDFRNDPSITFVIANSADALILTGGGVGTGAEGSVNGAQSVISTTSASRVQGDIIVARQDFTENNPEVVNGVVSALLKAEELFREDLKKQTVDFERIADTLLQDGFEEDILSLWRGVETVGLAGQVDWADDSQSRSYRKLVNETQNTLVEVGLLDRAVALQSPVIDATTLGEDLWDKRRVEASGFDQEAAQSAVRDMSQDEMDGNTISTVTIYFEPNQTTFDVDKYEAAFADALEQTQIYGGAVLSIEAHSSYLGYLRGVLKQDWSVARQKRELTSLKNTSTARALSVRDALIEAAGVFSISVDESQFVINGRGIEDPLGGFCENALPCPPKTEQEWKDSRRVIFRVIAMESEAEVFTPLNEW